ncbi:extracellular solute-binding protein, partial [Jeotgalibaca porci]
MKSWKIASLSLAATVLLAACGGTESDTASSADNGGELIVSTFALSEDVIKRDVLDPFSEENDVEITYEVGNSSERFTKLQNNPNSTIDVIELSQANAATGVADGLFEELDETKVPNLAKLVDGAKDAIATSGAPYTMNSIGII